MTAEAIAESEESEKKPHQHDRHVTIATSPAHSFHHSQSSGMLPPHASIMEDHADEGSDFDNDDDDDDGLSKSADDVCTVLY